MAKDALEDDDDVSVCSDSGINDECIKRSFSSFWRPNAHGGHHSYSSVLQPISKRYQEFTPQIRASPLEEWEGGVNIAMSNTVTTAIRSSVRGMAIGKTRTTDKADRATVENVNNNYFITFIVEHITYSTRYLQIDPRTRMVLYKLLSRGELENIYGCISTGKEANVYYGTKSNGQERAIKTYRTSVLAYKDRVRYVDGDRRFTNDYCGSNHGKMVKTWAKKEMRNLLRVKAEGIMCPTPYLLKEHVLVMEFIGKDGCAAPRLKDANLSLDMLRKGYVEIIVAMRTLYQNCRLVHGDLSEYNILYYAGHLYIIDVSQAVDPDHPRALKFLIEDCIHVSDFFKRHGVGVMRVIELFVFIFDASIVDSAVANYLEEVQQKILARGDVSIEDEIADRDAESQSSENEDNESDSEEISSFESDTDTIEHSQVIFDGESNLLKGNAESQSDKDEDIVSDCKEISSYESDQVTPLMKKAARKEARKENKKKVKEEKRQARKTKVRKAVKKRKLKKSKAPKTR
ncbi:non-specific serine/threonine protein kinase [Trifolium repens]|nr:non-specific serine/threonine protein kinase [Trifolium repens]